MNIQAYEEAVNYINSIPKFHGKSTMEDTKRFLALLPKSEGRTRFVHVAGTNGKGSVCMYMTNMLCALGYKVSTFVSPHLVDMEERFLVNAGQIDKERFLALYLRVREILANMPLDLKEKGYHPSFFEFLFFMEMLLVAEDGPDYVILETGLGGRLDATNAIEQKDLCIITTIGYDHTEYLGSTLQEIAGEKAGIIKSRNPVVFWAGNQDVISVIEDRIRQLDGKAYPVNRASYEISRFSDGSIDFSFHSLYDNNTSCTLPYCVPYQLDNVALVLRSMELLVPDFWQNIEKIHQVLTKTRWRGRMEQLRERLYLDGAHNENGTQAFLECVRTQKAARRVLLYSVVKDKQYGDSIRMLADSKLFDLVYLVQLQGSRALAPKDMEEIFAQCGTDTMIVSTVEQGLLKLEEEIQAGATAYIVGSLYLAGEVLAAMEKRKND